MTDAERRAALEAIAGEVQACTNCRLHEGRTRAVPGEGDPDTEVVFVGEGPGFNEDRLGRPFVGRAGDLLVRLLATIGWRREDVFITNVVKCRPPDNRDPMPDEIAACAPYLRRQLEVLDPAIVVTLGRYSMGRFMPGARISSAHGTVRPVDPATGAANAMAFAMYHPAAALRTPSIERDSYADIAAVPGALLAARARREAAAGVRAPGPADAGGQEAKATGPSTTDEVATPLAPLVPVMGEATGRPVMALVASDGEIATELADEAADAIAVIAGMTRGAVADPSEPDPGAGDDAPPQLTLF